MKSIWLAARDAVAFACAFLFVDQHNPLKRRARCASMLPPFIGRVALAALTVVLLSFGTAQAQTATTTTVTSSPNPSLVGQAVFFHVVVTPAGSGTPTGCFNVTGNSNFILSSCSSPASPFDWLAWFAVRGTDFSRSTVGNDLKGNQIDGIAGLTWRLRPDFVIGVLGGYERFDYSSQAFNGTLKGDGWTVGAYLGWKLSPNIRFDAGTAWAAIMANDTAGTAKGSFTGTHWLASAGLTGTYLWEGFVFEPSARVFTLWEREKAFTDSLGTLQPAHNFENGRASAGVKAIYPFVWTSSVALSPYAGIYADYYFSRDDAQTAAQTTALTTVPLLQGWSARATGGVTATFPGGASLGAGGEFGGIGGNTHIWTWTARGHIPF